MIAGLEKLSSVEAGMGAILARCLDTYPQLRPDPAEFLRLLVAFR